MASISNILIRWYSEFNRGGSAVSSGTAGEVVVVSCVLKNADSLHSKLVFDFPYILF